SRVSAAMNRLTGWVFRHPAGIVLGVFAVVLPLAVGMTRLSYESNYINLFRPNTRVVRDYHAVEAKLGGIGLVQLIIPAGRDVDGPMPGRLRTRERAIAAPLPGRPPGVSFVLSLATVLDPDGRLAELPADAENRTLRTKLELIEASPQAELLRSFWNAETGQV